MKQTRCLHAVAWIALAPACLGHPSILPAPRELHEGSGVLHTAGHRDHDVDRSLRNDVGWWITFAGPFRYMDLMGVQGYHFVMRDLLPELSSESTIPRAIDKVVASGGRGISNGRGFYRYTPAEAKRWEKLFVKFNYEIRRLALKYPADAGNVKRRAKGSRNQPA